MSSGAEAEIIFTSVNTSAAFTHGNRYAVDLNGGGTHLTINLDVAGGYLGASATASSLAVDGLGLASTRRLRARRG